jgi:hypothetical protein
MDEATEVETGSGVVVSAAAPKVAAGLAKLVREATADLAFGAEPSSFLVALERLAGDEAEAS